MMIPCQLCNTRTCYHCPFCTCTCYVGEIMIPCQLSTFSEFIWNALMSYGLALIIPWPLVPGPCQLSTFNFLKLMALTETFNFHLFSFFSKLITNLWFKQFSKNSNFNYSNLKTNGTNRKFIIFLKLMALTESL